MAHNPIIKRHRLGMNQPALGKMQCAVLRHQGVLQVVEQGQALPLAERFRLRNADVFIVDQKPHDWEWRVKLMSADDDVNFDLTVTTTYQVHRPRRVVDSDEPDFEKALARRLRPTLQPLAQSVRLNDHKLLCRRVADAIFGSDVFAELGLRAESVKAAAELTESDKARIKEIEAILAAERTPRHAQRTGKLPTKNTFQFDAKITLQVRVASASKFDTLDELEAAISNLWEGPIQRRLRPISRQFSFREVGTAEEALNEKLEALNLDDYDLRVDMAAIDIEPDQNAHAKIAEKEIAMLDGDVDATRIQIARKNMQSRMDMLADMVQRGEMSREDVLAYLDGKELEATSLPMDTIEKLRGLDILDQDTGEDAARMLLMSTLAAAASKQNPTDAEAFMRALLKQAQLTAGGDEEDESNEPGDAASDEAAE